MPEVYGISMAICTVGRKYKCRRRLTFYFFLEINSLKVYEELVPVLEDP